MAKKAAKKKAPAKKKQSKKEVEKILRSGAIRRRPKDVALPGLEGVVSPIPALTKVCASLSDVRASINESKGLEKALLAQALPLLINHKRVVYKAHGVELIHVHGDDKVRARLVSDDSEGSGPEEDDDDVTAEDGVTGDELEA